MPLNLPCFLSSPVSSISRHKLNDQRALHINQIPFKPMMQCSTSNSNKPVPHELKHVNVLGLGLVCMDLLASVPHFPQPDTKIRTEKLVTMGGGNCANTCSGIRRLGLPVTFISQTGNDLYGQALQEELQNEDINISHMQIRDDVQTTFTYIIIDTLKLTRTCISTVSNIDIQVNEHFKHDIHNMLSQKNKTQFHLCVLDGRHTLASTYLAQQIKQLHLNIPILLDIERNRPYIHDLLPLVDYIVTNDSYPFIFTSNNNGDDTHNTDLDLIHAMYSLLNHCNSKFIITTLGSGGCKLLRKFNKEIDEHGDDHFKSNDIEINSRLMTIENETIQVFECSVWKTKHIVDTTGAGDAFIAGISYGLATNMNITQMLKLASYVASCKLGSEGSRSGLPRRETIPESLIEFTRTIQNKT